MVAGGFFCGPGIPLGIRREFHIGTLIQSRPCDRAVRVRVASEAAATAVFRFISGGRRDDLNTCEHGLYQQLRTDNRMKRILLETLCAMAVLVFLASLHSRVSSIKENKKEVAELRDLARATAESIKSIESIHSERIALVAKMETKVSRLEQQVAAASFDSSESRKMQIELGQTRREAALLKAQLREDISRTQETVDAYQKEMRTKLHADEEYLRQTRDDIALLAVHLQRDPNTLTEEVLSPAVQLNGDDTVGSGTLIFSDKNPKTKKVETYAITSYHVVRNILADTPRAKREGISITIYDPKAKGGREELRCDVVSFDSKIDAALVRIRTTRTFKNLARVISKDAANKVQVWDSVYAIGCPLGNDPIPSQGEVSSLHNELNGANYWMINAPTYFGNSGGAVYLSATRELTGVFSKIYTHGRGNPVVIPHMGLFTPMPLIYDWLEREKLAFVLSNSSLPARERPAGIQHLAAPR
jgi:S1-C subfamily serine protease